MTDVHPPSRHLLFSVWTGKPHSSKQKQEHTRNNDPRLQLINLSTMKVTPTNGTTTTTQDPTRKDYYIRQASDEITWKVLKEKPIKGNTSQKPEDKRKLPSSSWVTHLWNQKCPHSDAPTYKKKTNYITDPRQITTRTLTRNQDINCPQHEQTENKYNTSLQYLLQDKRNLHKYPQTATYLYNVNTQPHHQSDSIKTTRDHS